MAIHSIICKSCGANQFSEVNGLYVCNICGTKHILSDDGNTYNVFVDGAPLTIEEYFIAAKAAYSSSDYQQAQKLYKDLLSKCPMNWEPIFYLQLLHFLNFNQNTDFNAQRKSFMEGLPSLFKLIKNNYDVIDRHSAMLALCSEFRFFYDKLDSVFDDRDRKLKNIRANMLASQEEISKEINAQCARRYEAVLLANDFRNYILASFAEDKEIQSIAYALIQHMVDELSSYYVDFCELYPEAEDLFWQCFALLSDSNKEIIYRRYGIRDIVPTISQTESLQGKSIDNKSITEDNYATLKGWAIIIVIITLFIKGCS